MAFPLGLPNVERIQARSRIPSLKNWETRLGLGSRIADFVPVVDILKINLAEMMMSRLSPKDVLSFDD